MTVSNNKRRLRESDHIMYALIIALIMQLFIIETNELHLQVCVNLNHIPHISVSEPKENKGIE